MYRYSRHLAILLSFAFINACASSGRAQTKPVTADQIQNAIDKAQALLLKSQAADGSWDLPNSQFDALNNPTHTWGGYTALATYALLASGYDPQKPEIKHAVAWLETCQMHCVYCIGIRMQVWLLMYQSTGPSDTAARAHFDDLATKDVKTLIDALGATGPYAGLWNYLGKAGRVDHSVSQYGVLGLWAAEQMGGEIPLKTWQLLDKTWRDGQFPDGGWSYASTPNIPGVGGGITPSASMTAAGVASLFITQEYANPGTGLKCEGNIPNDAIANGLQWMTDHFAYVNDLYTYYGVERIGVASGYKYFGKTDWFATIASKLMATQWADGSWPYQLGGVGPSVGTSFGLLFLARGGAPVMMNKLDYSFTKGHGMKDARWNERPRDAFNLSRWTGSQAEAQNLNWQVVNLQAAADDLHDAPILYIAGDRPLKLTAADIDMLRKFVQGGGMILGNADCSNEGFARSFENLGHQLFPKYEFNDLGKGDLIYTGETYGPKSMRGTQRIRYLDNGVRKIMLLFVSGDPARRWQTNSTKTDTDEFKIGADIFLYATDQSGLRNKADTYIVRLEPGAPSKSIKLARLMVGDNPDPEPGGWDRLTAILHKAPYSLGVTVTPVKSGEVLTGNYQIVHLTGTTAFKLKPEEETILQNFVKGGGTIIVDAAGGSGVFAASAEAALKQLFPAEWAKGNAHALPLTSPVFNVPNAAITEVKYRRFAKRAMSGGFKIPRLLGIEVGGRLAIFYSREDLSAGMVGEQVDGINGYDPASSTALMRNIVLFSAK